MQSIPVSECTSPSVDQSLGRGSAFQRGFVAWVDLIDVEVRRTISEYSAWLGVTVLAAIVIAAAGVVPATRGFFGLQPERAALSYLPIFVVGMSLGFLQKRRLISLTGFGVLALLGITCFQFFMWSLVGLSQLPGASVMVSLPLVLACYHGYVLHSAPRTPYVALAVVAGGVAAALVNGSEPTRPIFALGLPLAVGCALLLGRNSVAYQRERKKNVALREAIDAQLLSERAHHAEVLSQALGRLQGTSHDAGNALSGVLFNLEQLVVEASRTPLTNERAGRIGDMARDLFGGLTRLRELMLKARDIERASLPKLEVVSLARGVERAVASARTRFPHVRIRADIGNDNALGSISGGELTLDRVLNNLVINACQGDGIGTANSVWVRLTPGKTGNWLMSIEDDGPGYPDAMLQAPFRELSTTKRDGTGLGLYVSERLMRASGGSLELTNAEQGGARATVSLQRFDPA